MNYSTTENTAGVPNTVRPSASVHADAHAPASGANSGSAGVVQKSPLKSALEPLIKSSGRSDITPDTRLKFLAQAESKTNPKSDANANLKASLKGSSKTACGPSLVDYTDYRLYLKDVYEFRRATESTGVRAYSYSTFSAAADIRSPNYLKLIIEGRRNLSEDMITRFAKALRLARIELEEFRALVRYSQAVEPIERNKYLKDLSDLRALRTYKSGEVNQATWDKVPGWIGWVLYAMADQGEVDFDPQNLHRLFRTKASPDDIRESLEKLIASGELARNPETGQVSKARDLIESPQDLPVPLIRKLQTELIYLGIESLFRDSPKEREFGAMTVAMTEEEFNQVRFELRQLRKRLQRDILVKRKVSKGERVYQLNVQLFPVTDKV